MKFRGVIIEMWWLSSELSFCLLNLVGIYLLNLFFFVGIVLDGVFLLN